MVLEKSLGFGYGRDLQEDKAPLFEAFEVSLLCLRALGGAIATATFVKTALEGALDAGHVCATDLADYLVQRGVPFREAHHVVGALVREAEARGVQLGGLEPSTLGAAHESLTRAEVSEVLDPKRAVERRALLGGPAKLRVTEAIRDARKRWQLA
jgi:argininosuccinate lyase